MDEERRVTVDDCEEINEEAIPVYANNTRFRASVWDLRILFGQLLLERQGVEWHTDITLPWPQAKLMHHYLGINLGIYELENGKITIPAGVLPQTMETPAPGVDPSSPQAIETYEFVRNANQAFRDAQLKDR